MESDETHEKIEFLLTQDADGYPPVGRELLWAIRRSPVLFEVDNIPLYVKGISSGDVVEAVQSENGDWLFQRLVQPSGNSTFRVYVTDPEQMALVRSRLQELGCLLESSDLKHILAVEIPEDAPIESFLSYAVSEQEKGAIDLQEGALRHRLPGHL